jgi:hypothetical protein
MGLQEAMNWLRCSPWAKWLFILGGAGGGFFAGGKLKYKGGKRAIASAIGGGTGWLISWLLARNCNGGNGGEDMLPEWVPPDDGTEHLLGPSKKKSYVPQTMPDSIKMATTPMPRPSMASPRPSITTTNEALKKTSPTTAAAPPGVDPTTGAGGAGTPGATGGLTRRRPTRNVATLLGGGRGKAYGS